MKNAEEHPESEKSKSQRKREMTALQELGERLVALPKSQLKRVPLPDTLAIAIAAAQSITSHEGLRRQLQYIGRLMRTIDPEPIQQALAAIENRDQLAKNRLHQLENWRSRLIIEGIHLMEEAMQVFPTADRQQLRQLIRNAQKEAESSQTAASRKLFRYLRDLDSGEKTDDY